MSASAPITVEALHQRALAGDTTAQFALARVLDREGRHEQAVAWLQRAADAGDAAAAGWLGARLLVGRAAPFAPEAGAALVERAARAGSADAAARLAVLAATGAGRAQDWTAALDWLARAAQGGDASARTQLALLSALAAGPAAATGAADPWAAARGRIRVEAWLAPPPAEVLSQTPHVARIQGFLHPAICDWLIERVRPRLAPARVYDAEAGGRREHEMRSNTGAGFGLLDTDLILALVRARAAAAAGVAAAMLEPTNVLHYEVGQTFEPHFDFVDPEVAHFADDLRLRGQRTTTLLVYLNDDFEGGETAFPDAGRSFRGARGDALIFRNVDAAGRPDRASLHAGTPPTRGEKWLLSQWVRDRAQPIV